jgi:hypothetical protein
MRVATARARRGPSNSVIVHLYAVDASGIPLDVGDAVVRSVVEAWDPLAVGLATTEVAALARRGGWKLPPGHRVWVADAVGTIDQVAPGGRSERLAAGSLLSLPDDWSPEQVVHVVLETFVGLDEIPH